MYVWLLWEPSWGAVRAWNVAVRTLLLRPAQASALAKAVQRIRTSASKLSPLRQRGGMFPLHKVRSDLIVGGSAGFVEVDDAIAVSPTDRLTMSCSHRDVGVEQSQQFGILRQVVQL